MGPFNLKSHTVVIEATIFCCSSTVVLSSASGRLGATLSVLPNDINSVDILMSWQLGRPQLLYAIRAEYQSQSLSEFMVCRHSFCEPLSFRASLPPINLYFVVGGVKKL